jgi:hypothetical protein
LGRSPPKNIIRKLVGPFSLFVLFLAGTLPVFAQGSYSMSWQYHKKIMIDHTEVPNTDQSNFPVLISLSAAAGLSAHAQRSGNDILFTSNDGTTKMELPKSIRSGSNAAAGRWWSG